MINRKLRIESTDRDMPIIGYRTCQVCNTLYPIYRGQGNSKHCLSCANTVKRQQNKECAMRIRVLNTTASAPYRQVVGALSLQQMSPERMIDVFRKWSEGKVDIV